MKELFVIEGLDGSGKATQAKMLFEELEKSGTQVKEVSFPNYDSDASALVKMYLSGQFGTDPNAVNAYAASSFYAVDRFASYKKNWADCYEKGVIIADRYTSSNAIYQCSKLFREEWDDFLEWLFEFEYGKLGIPEPTAVIYLKVDPEISQTLMTKRYRGDESKKDIHERNLNYIKKCQDAALYCSQKFGWKVIECCSDGQMRSMKDIHEEIMDMINRIHVIK